MDELLRRLRTTRFVAIVGTSGSGKSSLVRSGLIPALQGGFMAGAGSSWRIAIMRPGEDPIGHLAAALDGPQVLGGNPEVADTSRMLLEVTLRRSSLGLTEAVRQARLPADENVLVIVDQFEELFRFRESCLIPNSRDEAVAFIRLLLDTAARPAGIFVVLTMRSDFIGDCMNFPGLPEAVNEGLFLVGRMSRDGLRAAITGPVAVAGGTIAPRLVNRVLNDLGDDHDQLPLMQHALMRTWAHWAGPRRAEGAIDVEDYEAVGTFRDALSRHAEEAYDEAVALGLGETVRRVFKALTDTFSDPRGVRRPAPVSTLASVTGAPEADVIQVVEVFRRPGRCFLMPPATVPVNGPSIVDLSHESLMRCWGRLITWAQEERAAVAFYVRLAQAAAWNAEGAAGLWRTPELELAQQWRSDTRPTAAWAERHASGFERAMAFLDRSVDAHERAVEERERERRARLRRTQFVAAVLAMLLLVAAGLGAFAWMERHRAQANLALAREAVDESLAAADRDPNLAGAEAPEVEELRRELLAKAERFYLAFMDQEPRGEQARRDLAKAHLRLGHINRLLDRRQEAEQEYRQAIAGLTELVSGDAGAQSDRQALATAYNSLGESLRRQIGRQEEAADHYERALQLQQQLVAEAPDAAPYRVDLARTLYNRGILRSATDAAAAEADFRESIRLLEGVVASTPRALQDLGRAANNLGALLDGLERPEARTFYERAVAAHERLVAAFPENREYRLELATFGGNLAMLLHDHGDAAAALERSHRSLALLGELTRPPPSLAIERADASTMHGMLLGRRNPAAAAEAYAKALDVFAGMDPAGDAVRMPMFHVRFGDLLVNLAVLARASTGDDRSRQLLAHALDEYTNVAGQIAQAGTAPEMRAVLETLDQVEPALEGRERARLAALQDRLRRALGARGPS